ncbi:MAG: hypothetical protein GDA52_04270 [Rhodobacteraceae bacterium]|nr:hypothetical protein [Paracoccaceae bacterium]
MRDASGRLLSGSYDLDDVTFLLKPVHMAATGIRAKERLIQTGAAHYSEMISEERRPDARYLEIFEDAFRRSTRRMGTDIARIAATIADKVGQRTLPCEITLCSLVRAGVPYGVLLHRALKGLGLDSIHYGVSIIRDRGLDANAMAYIFARRDPDGVIFVDGWTGKGAISRELRTSWANLGRAGAPELAVLADPGGFATVSGSHDDWLIPSGILGANISGLISRSILNARVVGPNDFHGAMSVDHLRDMDISRRFVNAVSRCVAAAQPEALPILFDADHLAQLRAATTDCMGAIIRAHDVDNPNRIKPGLAEATRAVLRRRPDRVFLRDASDPDAAAIVHLCRTDAVPIVECTRTTGPYRAITLIKKVS